MVAGETVVGVGVVPVRPDLKGFAAATSAQLKPTLQAVSSQLGGSFNKLGGFAQTFGATAQASFVVAGAAAVKFGVDAVQAASSLNESINKTEVVFEDAAESVLAFGRTAPSIGLVESEALDAAAGFGQMLETAGIATDKAADMSIVLTKLAADMASFNNTDPSEMLIRLRAGLAGEAEPLRRVGVLLSEARVKQEAYRLGIAATGAELTEGQKVQARYSLILQDTAKQQGDFARTSDSLANQQRVLRAEWVKLQTTIGQVFLPLAQRVVKVLGDMTRGVAGLVGWLDQLDFTFKGVNIKFVDFLANVSEAPLAFGGASTSVVDLLDDMDALDRSVSKNIDTTDEYHQALFRMADAQKQVGHVTDEFVRGIAEALHMNRADFAAWKRGTRDDLNGVEGALEDLADGTKTTTREILRSFSRQLDAMKNYQRNWETLLARGLPADMAQQIQDLGLEGAGVVRALAKANDEQFDKIVAKWVASQGVAKATSNEIAGIGRTVRVLPNGKTIFVYADISQAQDRLNAIERQLSNLRSQASLGLKFEKTATGYNGMVTSPTLFLAGEAGPEHVQVTPRSGSAPRGASTAGGVTVVVNGDVYGMDDFEHKVGGAVAKVFAGTAR